MPQLTPTVSLVLPTSIPVSSKVAFLFTPLLSDLHKQLEVRFFTRQLFDLFARPCAQLLEFLSTFANQDTFLGVAVYNDFGVDVVNSRLLLKR